MTEALSIPDNKLVGLDGRPIVVGAPDDAPFWLDTEQDTKDYVAKALGDLDDVEVFYGWVLVVKHIRRIVAKGIIAAGETQNEDRWQGKVGLVVKKGPAAFRDDDRNKFFAADPKVGDWVIFRNSDGWDVDIGSKADRLNYLQCRFIQDAHIIGTTTYPGRIY